MTQTQKETAEPVPRNPGGIRYNTASGKLKDQANPRSRSPPPKHGVAWEPPDSARAPPDDIWENDVKALALVAPLYVAPAVGVMLESAEHVESWSGRRPAPFGASLGPRAQTSALIPRFSSASNDNVGEPTSRGPHQQLAQAHKTLLKLARNGNLFCLRQQYTYRYNSSFWLSKTTCALC